MRDRRRLVSSVEFPAFKLAIVARSALAASLFAVGACGCSGVFGFMQADRGAPAPQVVDAEAAGVTLQRASYTPHTAGAAPRRATARPAGLVQCATGAPLDAPCRRSADRHSSSAPTALDAARTFTDE